MSLVNAPVSYRHGPFELSAFANNLFNEDYFESYIERTTLVARRACRPPTSASSATAAATACASAFEF